LQNDDPPGVFVVNDAASEDVLHQIRVSNHSSFAEKNVVAKFLDRMDNYKSQFLVMALFECRSEKLFTNVVNDMFLSIVVILDEHTNDETIRCRDVDDIILIVSWWRDEWRNGEYSFERIE